MTDTRLPYNYTVEKLAKLTVKERNTIWERARRSSDDADKRLVAAIERAGPFEVASGIRDDDLISHAMHRLIFSDAGRRACFDAIASGLPALAGVEQMIVAELADEYRTTYMATVQAGSIVGAMMRSAGYSKTGEAPMPHGSVAKTAATWERR